MNEKIVRLGLIGKDVSKSVSPAIHTFILEKLGYGCRYEKFSVGGEGFDLAMRRLMGDFDGFNVTIPYKRDVMEYLDRVEGDAFEFGSVNTVVTATRTGYNTDGVGFLTMTRLAGISFAGKKVLVLGGGGAGRSTAAAVKKEGATVFIYQRNREKLEETCRELGVTPANSIEGFDILINATGVGMHDSEGVSPVGRQAFIGGAAAIDLIYEPAKSEFLRLAEEAGLQILNGASMLFYQAYYADCLFLGISPCDKQAEAFYKEFKKKTEEERL